MNIYFLGNCQTNALKAITHDVTEIRPGWGSITEFWGRYDPDAIEVALDGAEVVVALAILNPDHPYSADKLRKRFKSRLILTPYVYIDGLASLELVSSKGRAIVRGAKELQESSFWPNMAKLMDAFSQGQIDMRQKERFHGSLARLTEAESQCCDIKIANYIDATWQERPLLYAMNHPTQHVLFEMFRQLADILGLRVDQERLMHPLTSAKRALPRSQRALSPYDVEAHKLNYGADSHWFAEANKLIQLAIQKNLAKSSPE